MQGTTKDVKKTEGNLTTKWVILLLQLEHWCLVVASIKGHSITLCNSLVLMDVPKEDQLMKLGNTLVTCNCDSSPSKSTRWNMRRTKTLQPQQEDSNNCGMFVMMAMPSICEGKNPTDCARRFVKNGNPFMWDFLFLGPKFF